MRRIDDAISIAESHVSSEQHWGNSNTAPTSDSAATRFNGLRIFI
jgi:hypothetical protein